MTQDTSDAIRHACSTSSNNWNEAEAAVERDQKLADNLAKMFTADFKVLADAVSAEAARRVRTPEST